MTVSTTARGLRAQGDPRDLDTLRADLLVTDLTGRPPQPRMAATPAVPRQPGEAVTAR